MANLKVGDLVQDNEGTKYIFCGYNKHYVQSFVKEIFEKCFDRVMKKEENIQIDDLIFFFNYDFKKSENTCLKGASLFARLPIRAVTPGNSPYLEQDMYKPIGSIAFSWEKYLLQALSECENDNKREALKTLILDQKANTCTREELHTYLKENWDKLKVKRQKNRAELYTYYVNYMMQKGLLKKNYNKVSPLYLKQGRYWYFGYLKEDGFEYINSSTNLFNLLYEKSRIITGIVQIEDKGKCYEFYDV